MQETKLMMQSLNLCDRLSALWKKAGGRRVFEVLEKAERRKERRMRKFVRRVNWNREDEILQADVIE